MENHTSTQSTCAAPASGLMRSPQHFQEIYKPSLLNNGSGGNHIFNSVSKENQNDEEMPMPYHHMVKQMCYDSDVKQNSNYCAEELENHGYMSPA